MFTTDNRTENFLSAIGVKFHYDDALLLKELIPGWAKNNIGRSQDQIESAVLEYAELMSSGSAAPAPIVQIIDDGVRPLDGVQRLLAAELQSYSTYAGYVAETNSDITVAKIRVMANARLQGGYQESKEWTLERAVQILVIDQGLSHQEVASLGGWQVSRVRDKHHILEAKIRIRGVGGPDFSDKMVKLIDSHADSADFVAASQPVSEFLHDLKAVCRDTDEARIYVSDFFKVARNKPRLYNQFVSKLAEFRQDDLVKAQLNGGKLGRLKAYTPDGQLLRSLRSSLTVAKNLYNDHAELAGEMDQYYQLVNQIQGMVKKLGKRRTK